ncbi:MAG: TIGR03790 family protein, partial [Geopsychrobacter sp.]|nr:TIGR03790 family protein [Geopsychrobacter sp.]
IENKGLTGRAYFDARWKVSTKKNLQGYALYDQSLHNAAKNLKQSNMMPVIVDNQPEVFQVGEAPHAALYCGWYSLAKYVDAFVWQKGAIGYHLASAECSTLKKKGSQVWCKRMLEEGVAATIGPVYEPYIQGFPVPEVFFKYLTDGFYSLAEAYYLSLPYLSWQMVLIGDPLYRPFRTLSRTK